MHQRWDNPEYLEYGGFWRIAGRAEKENEWAHSIQPRDRMRVSTRGRVGHLQIKTIDDESLLFFLKKNL